MNTKEKHHNSMTTFLQLFSNIWIQLVLLLALKTSYCVTFTNARIVHCHHQHKIFHIVQQRQQGKIPKFTTSTMSYATQSFQFVKESRQNTHLRAGVNRPKKHVFIPSPSHLEQDKSDRLMEMSGFSGKST
jgi:hypothetical protein